MSESKSSKSLTTVYRLELEGDGSLSKRKQFIRLPPPVKPYILRFNIRSGSFASHGGVLYTNHPLDGGDFERASFRAIRFPNDFSKPLNVDIVIQQSGSFEFYVEYQSLPTPEKTKITTMVSEMNYFTVDPILETAPRNRILSAEPLSDENKIVLPLDGIVIQSLLPKLMGTLSQWDAYMKDISDLGYNMVHFVPMQARGSSDSPYSIYDQLSFSDDLFEEEDRNKSNKEKIGIIGRTVSRLDEEYGILSLSDIVWNHTASNSQWLQEHPEACYNLVNSPHLIPAYELDSAFREYSKNLSSLGLPTFVHSESDLNAVIEGVKQHVIKKIKLWEFYVIDIKEALEEFKKSLENDTPVGENLFKDINIAALSFKAQADLLVEKGLFEKSSFGQRFHKKIDIDVARAFIDRLVDALPVSEYTTEIEETYVPTNEELKLYQDPELIETEKKKQIEEMSGEKKSNFSLESITERPTLVRASSSRRSSTKSQEKFMEDTQVAEIKSGSVELSSEVESRDTSTKLGSGSTSTETRSENSLSNTEALSNEQPVASTAVKPRVRRVKVTLSLNEIKIKKFNALINEINLPFYKEYDNDIDIILENARNRIRYLKLDPQGPKQGEINKPHPLIESYFTRIPLNEKTRHFPEGALVVANNGWIWNADPLKDFASSNSRAYLRREVIIWGDCVKMRYGESKEDSPWLWDHMKKYTELLASLFHGFRIDNCHSTPIHVGTYLLDAARSIRPNLYVIAELFTGSEETDIKFVRKLGINSLIREAMQAWDPRELSRLVHRHGGKPVVGLTSLTSPTNYKGSMEMECLADVSTCTGVDGLSDTPCIVVPVPGSNPHALYMDCTHDNQTPHQKRTAEDTLPNGALVTMTSCAIGSVKGYDEVYPKLVDLVKEKRHYKLHERPLDVVKKVLQHLHTEMAIDGYIETHVYHENDCVVVHRVHPHNHNGYLVIAHCAFTGPRKNRGSLSPMKLRGTKAELLFSVSLDVHLNEFIREKEYLTGLPSSLRSLNAPSLIEGNDEHGQFTEITLPEEFPSGSVILLRTWADKQHSSLDEFITSDVDEVFSDLNLVDLNIVLYRCAGEEMDTTGHGVYNIPDFGEIPYSGLEGFMSALRPIMKENDLGHPLCTNLRNGHWALDYVVDRLTRHLEYAPNLRKLCSWYRERITTIKNIPNFLIPKYFALLIKTAYATAIRRALNQMSPFVREGGSFIRSLAMCSVQMYGTVLSTGLHPTGVSPSMAAGLPHFTYRHMRVWGRDVFISLRGLFLTTGNYEAAREHILAFGAVLKHGMIPNLLDSGRRPRYNCRDATWWYLQAIQDYCKFSPEGLDFLKTPVVRRFPKNDVFIEADDPLAYKYKTTILQIIQEIMERHARGISFKEWNAGPNLDSKMTPQGFLVNISVDWNTGFLIGGNKHNCGTWMDKMGESEKAGNIGKPATPRDGAAVEIIGLLKSTLRWIVELLDMDIYPWKGVEIKEGRVKRLVTYDDWNDLVQQSFEENFYIPLEPNKDSRYVLNPKLVSRRGIYKDVHKSSREFEDYQLRPNFPIAMVVAPELFDPHHAYQALKTVREVLAGPLGMRTLDPADWAYRGDYDNNNDSTDPHIAKGWNYHQGPEWLWVTGYFLRAYLYFDTRVGNGKNDPHETVHAITRHLLPHRSFIETSPWAGLPELTNTDGAECLHACPTQAWSAATLLDLFDDIKKLENSLNA
ncbi:8825_t:CDS:10 [Acaulospora morrowiae]|uniref:Glycogen debranching enzyme n=1 Tax=Acaulospora morrowiae TaxID=94023 RepID=A0A9N8VRM4_9GLOM|nr:8825_t:CDS:10 [Acaulospora morrowiae]